MNDHAVPENSALLQKISSSSQYLQGGDVHRPVSASVINSEASISKAFGPFFMRYNCVPVFGRVKCDHPKCMNSTPSSIQLDYLFPRWLIQRVVSFSLQWDSLGGQRVNCNFKVAMVLLPEHPVWWAIQNSPASVFQGYLSKRVIYLEDVDEGGSPLLTVS